MHSLISTLKQQGRLSLFYMLFLSTSLSIVLIAFRIMYTSSVFYLFLTWNIFLAAIPLLITTYMTIYEEQLVKKKVLLVCLTALWLLFFPNAPYILTDLFHLRYKSSVPVWFDLILVLSCAWNGLIFGYLSLMDIQRVMTKLFNKVTAWIICFTALVLGAFGIYLGRYLRWNSWDIVSNPFGLFADIINRLSHPLLHPRTYGITLFYSAFLIVAYFTLQQMIKSYRSDPSEKNS